MSLAMLLIIFVHIFPIILVIVAVTEVRHEESTLSRDFTHTRHNKHLPFSVPQLAPKPNILRTVRGLQRPTRISQKVPLGTYRRRNSTPNIVMTKM